MLPESSIITNTFGYTADAEEVTSGDEERSVLAAKAGSEGAKPNKIPAIMASEVDIREFILTIMADSRFLKWRYIATMAWT